ncbi:MAG: hypothetical protein AAF447_17435 [Myxococcota bacterium]
MIDTDEHVADATPGPVLEVLVEAFLTDRATLTRRGLTERSRAAYRACAANARAGERYLAFERFCSQRRASLPMSHQEQAEGTVLEVIRE